MKKTLLIGCIKTICVSLLSFFIFSFNAQAQLLNQTLTITSPNTLPVQGTLVATASSTAALGLGGSIVFSITSGSGSATVNATSGLITGIGSGTVTLVASTAGNLVYAPATTSQILNITSTTPTLSITSANTLNVNETLTATVSTTAINSSGGGITYAIVAGSGSATVNSTTGFVTAISVGTVTLTATSAGDANYYPASVSQLITINKTTPTLTIISANTVNVNGALTVTTSTNATGGRGGLITYAIATGSGSATINSGTGLLIGYSVGTVTVTATSAGDTNYYSTSVSQLITINKTTPTLTITSADTVNVNGSLTATTNTSATGGRGGAFGYSILAGSGSATVNSSTGLINGVSAGTVILMVSSAGDSSYNSASASQVLIINMITPTLTITSSNQLNVDGSLSATVVTTATDGRGGAFSYSIFAGSGSATVNSSAGLINGVSAGTVTLMVSSVGDSSYNSASASQVLTINMITPTLTITSSNQLNVDGSLSATVVTTATDGRGGAFSYSILGGSGSATVDSSTGLISGVGAGTAILLVSSAGDASYNPASATQLLTVNMITPTLTITSSNQLNVDGSLSATVVTTATGGLGGAFSYSILGGSGSATVDSSSGLISGIGSGTVTLQVSSAGDASYNPASTSQVLTINMITPTLTISSGNMVNVGGSLSATVVTTATDGRGGAITFVIFGGSGSATVDSNTGLINGISAGTVTLTASSSGDTSYYPSSASQLIVISKNTPTLTISLSGTLQIGGASVTAIAHTTAMGGMGGLITYSITGGSGSATINSTTGLINTISTGTITLTASSAGDTNYNATSVSQGFTINKNTPVLAFNMANSVNVDAAIQCAISTTANNGGIITYSVMYGTGIAILNSGTGGILTGVQVGSVILTATSAATANYSSTSISQTIMIYRATPTLTVTSANSMIVGHTLTAKVNTSATYNRGGTVTFSIIAGSGSATVNPSTGLITAISAGTVTLVAMSAGNANYYPGTVTQVITISSSMLMAEIPAKTPIENGYNTTNERDGVVDLGVVASKALSPNGDGYNDTFIIQNIEKGSVPKCMIGNIWIKYDRKY